MLFLDNAAPDSCCAERPLHIPTYPRLVSTAATVREKTWEQIHTQTETDYNNPSLRMRARGLITNQVINGQGLLQVGVWECQTEEAGNLAWSGIII